MPALEIMSPPAANEAQTRPSTLLLSDILQKHSINSLLDQQTLINGQDYQPETVNGDTMSISDLLGLNSPRGLLNFGYSAPNSGLCTPDAVPNFQLDYDAKFQSDNPLNYAAVASPTPRNKSYQRNFSVDPTTPPPNNFYANRPFRSTSLSDSCGSYRSVGLDSPLLGSNSRSNSPESDLSGISSPDAGLSDLLVRAKSAGVGNSSTLTLNDAISRNLLTNELEPSALQHMSLYAIQASKYLQQPPSVLFNKLVTSACSLTSQQQLLDKWNGNPLYNYIPDNVQLDRAARLNRSAASVHEARCTWSGVLPSHSVNKIIGYSSKVFLGGVPWDISEQVLVQTFKQFGPIRVEWPGKEKQASQPKGYVYVIFESEKNVKALLQACTQDSLNAGNFYFKMSSKRMKSKQVQVIPWVINDSNYTKSSSQKLDPANTVFVGALHGMLNAEGLAQIMNDLFDGVVYAGIDTDKYKYPIGSGRVTFMNHSSYMKAVNAAFVEIKTAKFVKRVQIDPYLEDSLCSVCNVQQGPYFCRDKMCYRYFCRTCWQFQHQYELRCHKPLTRNSKNSPILGFGSAAAVAATSSCVGQ